jgi:hypothetical protein
VDLGRDSISAIMLLFYKSNWVREPRTQKLTWPFKHIWCSFWRRRDNVTWIGIQKMEAESVC